MSQLLDFYRGIGKDSEGRRLEELWAWDDENLEIVHDYIQWMFPLPEPSRANPDAPLLDREDIAAFHADPLLRSNLRRSMQRMFSFLGLALVDEKVVEAPDFNSRIAEVWAYPNHNWLRVTRIVRCLRLLGLGLEAGALYDRLEVIYSSRRFPILDDTFEFWSKAAAV